MVNTVTEQSKKGGIKGHDDNAVHNQRHLQCLNTQNKGIKCDATANRSSQRRVYQATLY